MIRSNKYVQAVLILLLLAVLVSGVYFLRNLIVYMVVSVFLAFVGRPLTHWLKTKHIGKIRIPDVVAAILVLTLQLGVVIGLIVVIVPLLLAEIQHWSQVDLGSVADYLEMHVSDWSRMAEDLKLGFKPYQLKESILKSLNIDISQIGSAMNNLAGGLSSMFIAIFSIVFITFFFLKEEGLSKRILYALINSDHHEKLDRIIPKTKNLLSRYFIGILLQVTIITILISVGLTVVGIEKILLIALFAGLVNVIPYVGPLIGALVGIILGAAQNLDLPVDQLLVLIGYMAIVFGCTQLIDNFVLQPLIYSNSVNAHPLEIFCVITAAGTLTGIGGMIIAVPFYSVFRIVAKEFLNEFQIIQNLTRDV